MRDLSGLIQGLQNSVGMAMSQNRQLTQQLGQAGGEAARLQQQVARQEVNLNNLSLQPQRLGRSK